MESTVRLCGIDRQNLMTSTRREQLNTIESNREAMRNMATMHAVRLHQYGTAENLIYEETQRPEIQAGEALVRVHAAGVNPVDWKTRNGRGVAGPPESPIILGWDIAGVVD